MFNKVQPIDNLKSRSELSPPAYICCESHFRYLLIAYCNIHILAHGKLWMFYNIDEFIHPGNLKLPSYEKIHMKSLGRFFSHGKNQFPTLNYFSFKKSGACFQHSQGHALIGTLNNDLSLTMKCRLCAINIFTFKPSSTT